MMARRSRAVTLSDKGNDAPAIRALCVQRLPKPVVLPAGLSPARASAIRLAAKKWVNGTILHFHFLENPEWRWADAQKDIVRSVARIWMDVGIGLSLTEVNDSS